MVIRRGASRRNALATLALVVLLAACGSSEGRTPEREADGGQAPGSAASAATAREDSAERLRARIGNRVARQD